ncbi:MAG: hypothetical protein HOI19_02460, partial [Rhodospirillaceae bacterium]|nr:hypothetical protein [Rhodospirillaceae bacterium]
MRRAFVILAFACLNSACAPYSAESAEYTTRPVQLDNDNMDRNSVGRLAWRGGLEITSTDGRFGGLSGLHITPDGRSLTAVGDRGYWFQAALQYRDGRLNGLQDATLREIRDEQGRPVIGANRDAESIATRDGTPMLVSFERRHRVWRFNAATSTAAPVDTPSDIQTLSNNGGVEAMTHLCNGQLLLVAEKNKTRERHVQGWIKKNNAWESFTYNTIAGFRPTGATTLPDCRIMFIERSFSLIAGVSARVTVMDAAAFGAGASITPLEIARFDFPVVVDNFEGIAARRSNSGETLVYILS